MNLVYYKIAFEDGNDTWAIGVATGNQSDISYIAQSQSVTFPDGVTFEEVKRIFEESEEIVKAMMETLQ